MPFDLDTFCRTLAAEAADAIIFADSEGLIRFWNKGAERIFGFAAVAALGRSLDIIIPERLRERHWKGYRAVMESGASRYGAGELLAVPGLRQDGARLSLEFTVLPFRGGDSKIAGIAAILRDVTARFEEMQRLRRLAGKDPR